MEDLAEDGREEACREVSPVLEAARVEAVSGKCPECKMQNQLKYGHRYNLARSRNRTLTQRT